MLTTINAINAYNQCADGDTRCVAESLAQMQALQTDLKARGVKLEDTERIGLNSYIASAQAALGNGYGALSAAAMGAGGAKANEAGNAGARNGIDRETATAGKLIGSTEGLTSAEQSFIAEMMSGGKTVQVIPSTNSGRTADFLIDGVKYELKTMSNVANQTSDGLSKSLSSTIMDARGQSGNIIIDARGQAGMTPEIAERGIGRAFGNDSQSGSKIEGVTVITSQGTICIQRKP